MERFEAHLQRKEPGLVAAFQQLQAERPSKSYDALESALNKRLVQLVRERKQERRQGQTKSERMNHPLQPGMMIEPFSESHEKELDEADEDMAAKTREMQDLTLLKLELQAHRENLRRKGQNE